MAMETSSAQSCAGGSKRVGGESLCIVEVFVPGEPAMDRLLQQIGGAELRMPPVRPKRHIVAKNAEGMKGR